MKPNRLLRDFIFESLYSQENGYFMKPTHELGLLDQPIRYNKLEGAHSYMESLGTNYPPHAFLTPVEIFSPWYGHSIAYYILNHSESLPITILEIGGGTGTCALSVLDFYQRNHRKAYNSIHYTLCEISPPIAAIADSRLKQSHSELHAKGQISVFNQSVLDWDQQVGDQCFVLGLEVLDNFPHDRVWRTAGEWTHQSEIEGETEVKAPISDATIRKALELWLAVPPLTELEREKEFQEGFIYNFLKWWKRRDSDSLFLPTGAYLMLQNLKRYIKRPHFIFADFDDLAGSRIPGLNAPIVSTKGQQPHESRDFDTLMVPKGTADIFFPVNFRYLNCLIREVFGLSSIVCKSHSFMKEHSKRQWTETKSAYTPLLDDFRNTSFLVTTTK